MASPNHLPEMQQLDSMTVTLYRLGLSVFAASAALHAIELLSGQPMLGKWHLPILAAGVATASANIHLYDPRFRWLFPLMGWLGLLALAFAMPAEPSAARHLRMIALGFLYAGASMFAMKEFFCFRISIIPLIPPLLAIALMLEWAGRDQAAGLPLAVAAAGYLRLCYAKWRMPLHFDIGDKSQYRI